MIILDDHLAILAIAGALPELDGPGPVVTTYTFQYRAARAVAELSRSGSLARRSSGAPAALARVLNPPADRLLILDPRASLEEAIAAAAAYSANLLLAELVGAALQHGASVNVTPANEGKRWRHVMAAAGVDFATVEP